MFPKLPRFLNVTATVILVFNLALIGFAAALGVLSLYSHDWVGVVSYTAAAGFVSWRTERSWTRFKNHYDSLEERSSKNPLD